MDRKPTYEELEQRNKDLEKEAVNCKRAEEALQESENLFNNVTNSIKELLVLLDQNFKLQLINSTLAQAYNVSLDEYAGKHCYELFYGRNDICEGCPAIKVLNEGKVTRGALRYRPDGRIYDRTAYPFIEDNGDITGVIVIGSDVTQQKQAEKELREREKELERKSIRLEEMNVALKVLLEKREKDKKKLEGNILSNVNNLVLPYMNKLKNVVVDEKQETYLEILESNINEIISEFSNTLLSNYMNLTPAEIQVANLVKQGKRTKELANLLDVSIHTIKSHRESIRKKIGIKNKKANLKSYLLSLG